MPALLSTVGIVLSRTNYGEADRIVKWLTPSGKISTLAKGVRLQKSKLAGGIELFSESSIGLVSGKSDLHILTSTRLIKHYGKIAPDFERTEFAYKVLKILNKTVEEKAGDEWFLLCKNALSALNKPEIDLNLAELWFNLRWLKLSGHSPNLETDTSANALKTNDKFLFNSDKMAFFVKENGRYSAKHIKLLRLCLNAAETKVLSKITDFSKVLPDDLLLSRSMLTEFIQI